MSFTIAYELHHKGVNTKLPNLDVPEETLGCSQSPSYLKHPGYEEPLHLRAEVRIDR